MHIVNAHPDAPRCTHLTAYIHAVYTFVSLRLYIFFARGVSLAVCFSYELIVTGVVTCRFLPTSASATHISYYSLLQPAFQHTSSLVGKLTARSPTAYKVSLANWIQNDSCTVYCDDLDGFYPRFYEPTDKGYAPALIFLGVGFCQGGRPAMRFLAVYS